MNITAEQLYDACDSTWPAAMTTRHGPWTIREGRGGGKRVSAATVNGDVDLDQIKEAELVMKKLGQTPLFMIREGDDHIDLQLKDRGYSIVDPVNMYSISVDQLTDIPIPRVTTFCVWEPLAIMAEIWKLGGIGPERLEVMERAKVKTSILARWNEKPAGAAFAAISKRVCMVHGVEILAHQRKQGVGKWIMRQAGFWAQQNGAREVAVLCVKKNVGANALYQSLGFTNRASYHYRQMGGTD